MISWEEITIRLVVASLLGAVIGIERERKDWAAGMRTHMMVCVGSALAMIVSAYGFFDILQAENVNLDPSRVAAQVISGIGFIGAGTILFLKQGIIRGLTTASGLWTVAAIGLAVGAGMYYAGGVTTALAITILWVLQPLERRLSRRFRQRNIRIVTDAESSPSRILKRILQLDEVDVSNFMFDKVEDEIVIQVRFDDINVMKLAGLVETLQKEPHVKEVLWMK